MNCYESFIPGQTYNLDPRLFQIRFSPSDKMTNPHKFMDICLLTRKVVKKICSDFPVSTYEMLLRYRLGMLSKLLNPCLLLDVKEISYFLIYF